MTARLQNGMYTLAIYKVDNNDYAVGQATNPNSLTNGTIYSPLIVKCAVSYTVAADTIESAYSYGNQQQRGKRELGTSTLGDGTLELSEFDADFDALVQGYTKDTTTGTGLEISAHNVNRVYSQKFMLAFTPAATPSNGTTNYDTIYTWGTLRRGALGSNQQAGRNPNNRSYTMTKLMSTRTPWGQLFSQSTLAPASNQDDEVIIYADAPIYGFTVVRDGTASGYVTPYALSYSAAASFGSANLLYMNGTATAQAVVNVSGGTALLLNGAGVSAQKLLVFGPSVAYLNA